jgi:hypothetical protein
MNSRILLAIACFPALAAGVEAPHNFSASVSAGGIHEECVKLARDETRRYEWSSDAAVDFNIHYHEGNEVFYPVKRDAIMKGKDTFKAKIAQDYCWMWTAKAAAKLEGKIEK